MPSSSGGHGRCTPRATSALMMTTVVPAQAMAAPSSSRRSNPGSPCPRMVPIGPPQRQEHGGHRQARGQGGQGGQGDEPALAVAADEGEDEGASRQQHEVDPLGGDGGQVVLRRGHLGEAGRRHQDVNLREQPEEAQGERGVEERRHRTLLDDQVLSPHLEDQEDEGGGEGQPPASPVMPRASPPRTPSTTRATDSRIMFTPRTVKRWLRGCRRRGRWPAESPPAPG